MLLAFALNRASNQRTLSLAPAISSAIVCEIAGSSTFLSAMNPVIWPCASASLP